VIKEEIRTEINKAIKDFGAILRVRVLLVTSLNQSIKLWDDYHYLFFTCGSRRNKVRKQ
jgi:hypothetical protein